MNIGTEILIIGGGATGLSVARDAVLRGFKTVVVEKGDLAHGTSGRYHGLLHSGGRYVVSDPQSARECFTENQILRGLIPSALEDTGGLFVSTPDDPPEYADKFLAACQVCGIPAEEIPVATALREEPLLNPGIRRVFRVPDMACDSFDTLHLLAADARRHGVEVYLRRRVEKLILIEDRVTGAVLRNLVTGEKERIQADLLLNCAGPWVGEITALAGCEVNVIASKGTMIAMNMRLTNTVVNRCKPPHDGDIVVPVGTVSILGTTEVIVKSADKYQITDHEISLLLAEGEKLIPTLRSYRPLRAWAGVRPLFDANTDGIGDADSRQVSRGHHVLNHRERDGVQGMLSIVGGKFTTMRLMAEELVDVACAELGVTEACTTASTPIEPATSNFYTLPQRLQALEERTAQPLRKQSPNASLICECELVTAADVEASLRNSGSHILNDLRRDTRLGMGPCQAGFCAYRAAGIASRELEIDTSEIINALAQFLQERWKGQRPLLWGHNLRQAELDLHIYRDLFGLDRLPAAGKIESYPTEKTA